MLDLVDRTHAPACSRQQHGPEPRSGEGFHIQALRRLLISSLRRHNNSCRRRDRGGGAYRTVPAVLVGVGWSKLLDSPVSTVEMAASTRTSRGCSMHSRFRPARRIVADDPEPLITARRRRNLACSRRRNRAGASVLTPDGPESVRELNTSLDHLAIIAGFVFVATIGVVGLMTVAGALCNPRAPPQSRRAPTPRRSQTQPRPAPLHVKRNWIQLVMPPRRSASRRPRSWIAVQGLAFSPRLVNRWVQRSVKPCRYPARPTRTDRGIPTSYRVVMININRGLAAICFALRRCGHNLAKPDEAPDGQRWRCNMKTLVAPALPSAPSLWSWRSHRLPMLATLRAEQIIRECMDLQNRFPNDGYEGKRAAGSAAVTAPAWDEHGQPA